MPVHPGRAARVALGSKLRISLGIAPRRSPELAGLSSWRPVSPHAVVVVDYQNIHLTGHDLWCQPGEAQHQCLIHPLRFAQQLLERRNRLRGADAKTLDQVFEPAQLNLVLTFRGQPSNRYDPGNYRRTQAQESEWERDDRSDVCYRPLKYYGDGRVAEKGVDVMIALEVVKQAAMASEGDIVILATHDTDQEPTLELGRQLAPGRVETAGWRDAKRLQVPGPSIWHTALERVNFMRSRDPKQYA